MTLTVGFYDCTASSGPGFAIGMAGNRPFAAGTRSPVRAANLDADKAKARAESLLLENLSELQRYDYIRRGYFEIQGQSGRRYQIGRSGTSGNVIEVDGKGVQVAKWCCNLGYEVGCPEGDHYLGQKLHLEHNEAEFLKTANRLS